MFAQTGYSIYVLRQASRRTLAHWEETAREGEVPALRQQHAGKLPPLTGKKLLVSLAMEGKFVSHGLQSLEDDEDMLTPWPANSSGKRCR